MAYSVTSGKAAQEKLLAVCQAAQEAAGIPVNLRTGIRMLPSLERQAVSELVAIRYETPEVREEFREYVLGLASQGPSRTLSKLSASERLIKLPEAEFTRRLGEEARRIAGELRKWGLM
jgi:hypothetical protein